VRKLAVEAADNGLLAPELASGIVRVKGVASKGVRLGNWLSIRQAQTLLNAPDATTTKGLRDRSILAVLLGCGLRRSEVAALTVGHVQQRDGRWCIVDLVGKHGRVSGHGSRVIIAVGLPARLAPCCSPKNGAGSSSLSSSLKIRVGFSTARPARTVCSTCSTIHPKPDVVRASANSA
jgi:hypothetical protein